MASGRAANSVCSLPRLRGRGGEGVLRWSNAAPHRPSPHPSPRKNGEREQIESAARPSVAAARWAAATLAACTTAAEAHGFGQRYDLPLPLSLYLWGTAAAVAVSFVIVGLFVRHSPSERAYPRVDLLAYGPARNVAHPAVGYALKCLALALFILT